MSRAAMQQALAYIEEVDYGPYDKWPVIIALKQALAEPDQYAAQNPLGGPAKVFDAMADAIRAGDDYHATLRRYGFAEVKALAEPEQEPDGISWLKRDSGYFTAPTPRKPLMDEEIELLAVKHAPPIDPAFAQHDDFIEFARAIERAHGIGGKE